jgi:hypothetical protein
MKMKLLKQLKIFWFHLEEREVGIDDVEDDAEEDAGRVDCGVGVVGGGGGGVEGVAAAGCPGGGVEAVVADAADGGGGAGTLTIA